MLLGSWRPLTQGRREERRRAGRQRRASLRLKQFKALIRITIKTVDRIVAHTREKVKDLKKSIKGARKVYRLCYKMRDSIHRLASRVDTKEAIRYLYSRSHILERALQGADEFDPDLPILDIVRLMNQADKVSTDTERAIRRIRECIQSIIGDRKELKKSLSNIKQTFLNRHLCPTRIINVSVVFTRAQKLAKDAKISIKELETDVKSLVSCFETANREYCVSLISSAASIS